MGSDARLGARLVPALLALGSCLLGQACGDGDEWTGDSSGPQADAAGLADASLDAGSPDAASGPLDAASADAAEPTEDANRPDAEPNRDGGPRLSVVHYEYSFDLAEASAEATLSLAAQAPGEGCTRLSSKLPLSELAAFSESPFSVVQQGSELSLCGSYRAGQPVTLSARSIVPLSSDPSTGVGYSHKLDRAGSLFSYLLGWVEACDLFGPCDPTPSALAHFTINVAHGLDDVVLCPGLREAGPRRTRCTLLGTQAPSYSAFSIAANPGWRSKPLVSAAGVDVLMFEGVQGSLQDHLDAAAVGDFLRFLSELLGPFPYGNELRVAGAPVPWLGMEHPANIVLREDLPELLNLYEDVTLHTLLHEIAHQWAGNRVTLASALDYAWKEAMAEYLVYTFEQRQRPASEATATLNVWHSTGTGAPYPVRPLVTPNVPLWVWTSGAYGSGPMTLFIQLEPYLGRAALLAAVQAF
jgi:aminopeptidase N